MIEFTCPKCRGAMSSPDSMADRLETCPVCGNVALCPAMQPVRSFVRRHRLPLLLGLAAVGGAALAVCWMVWPRAMAGVVIAHVPGIIPTAQSKPVPVEPELMAPASSPKGGFPTRSELDKSLIARGYFPMANYGATVTVRGRRLLAFNYVRDANFPNRRHFILCTRLDDDQRISAIVASLDGWKDTPAGKSGKQRLDAVQKLIEDAGHGAQVDLLLEAICGKTVDDNTEFSPPEKDGDTISRSATLEANGLIFEVLEVHTGKIFGLQTDTKSVILRE